MQRLPTSPESGEFAERLRKIMDQKGLSASDLARSIWGDTTSDQGYTVARNRDRIGKYIRGYSVPDTKNLLLLAKVLGVKPADLLPKRSSGFSGTLNDYVCEMAEIAGTHESLLRIYKRVPTRLAAQIIGMVSSVPDSPELAKVPSPVESALQVVETIPVRPRRVSPG
jgi:transcriptional regulator with XRE-family HTH domain